MPYDKFNTFKGQKYCDYLAKRLKDENTLIGILISAFIKDPNTWIGEISNDLSRYRKLKEQRDNKISNLSYSFRAVCIKLLQNGLKFDNSLGEKVFDSFMKNEMSVEEFIIFKKIFNFSVDKNDSYEYIYKLKYKKYEMLLNIDIEKYKMILKEEICALGNQ
jgi:hypothetical protein